MKCETWWTSLKDEKSVEILNVELILDEMHFSVQSGNSTMNYNEVPSTEEIQNLKFKIQDLQHSSLALNQIPASRLGNSYSHDLGVAISTTQTVAGW